MYLLVSASGMLWTGCSVDHSEMYVCHTSQIGSTIINSNQISCYKGKWYVRRFETDTVENGLIYSSVEEEEVFIYWVCHDIFCVLLY